MTPLIVQQREKYIAEMKHARELLPELAETLNSIRDGKAIVQLAQATFKEMKKNPQHQMTKEESAAVQAFILTKDIVLLKTLGDNMRTIDKGISLEQGTGTLEQRTERSLSGSPSPKIETASPNTAFVSGDRTAGYGDWA